MKFLKKLLLFALLSLLLISPCYGFDQVVIWGHKLHSHTHSYIHNAFYLAFKHMGYNTFWFDNSDDISHINFEDTLFITEGQADSKIPIRDDCQYILHNCALEKYTPALEEGRAIILQVYTDNVLNNPNAQKQAPGIYYDFQSKTVYMPWATDLFPEQIDEIKQKVRDQFIARKQSKNKYIAWAGTIGSKGPFENYSTIYPFLKAAEKQKISFIKKNNISVEQNVSFVLRSFMAPTLVGPWQQQRGYIPCRIFKNISYGQMGITNSERVWEIMEKKIVYDPKSKTLFQKALKKMKTYTLEELFEVMDIVKNKHTYLNRIDTLIDFLEKVEEDYFTNQV